MSLAYQYVFNSGLVFAAAVSAEDLTGPGPEALEWYEPPNQPYSALAAHLRFQQAIALTVAGVSYLDESLITPEDLSLSSKWQPEQNQPWSAIAAMLARQGIVVTTYQGDWRTLLDLDAVGQTGPGPEALEWYVETNKPAQVWTSRTFPWVPGLAGTGEAITELELPPSMGGAPDSTYTLPPYAVASRLRAEFFAHSVTRSAARVFESTGAKVGNGPAIGGVKAFDYDPTLNAAGAFNLTCSSLDEGFIPVLDGTAKEIKLYYENVGLVFHGRVVRAVLDDEGSLVVSGYDLGHELQNRTLQYAVITGATSAQEAYTAVLQDAADMGWSVTFETIASTISVPKQRFRHETVLDALREMNDVTALSFRVSATERQLIIGDLGADSGLQIAPMVSDDPAAITEGVLALLDLKYIKEEQRLINRVIPQGSNTSFGTAMDLRHAHYRRDKIGNAEPRRPRGETREFAYNFHDRDGLTFRTHTVVKPSALGAHGSPVNVDGPTDPDGPITDWLDYAADNPNWNIGATAGQVGLAQAFTPDAATTFYWFASRWAGVLTLSAGGPAYPAWDNMAPVMRIYNDSGGQPGTPLTDWIEPTNYINFGKVPGAFRTGARPMDIVVYNQPPNEVIHALPEGIACAAGTQYWAVYAVTPGFSHSITQGRGTWLVPCGGPNFAAHFWDDLGSLYTEGVSAGSQGSAIFMTSTQSQGTLTVAAQPSVGDTIRIGARVLTVVPNGTASLDGEVDEGADLTEFQANLIAAINGSDGFNTASADAEAASAWVTNTLVVTALQGGPEGDSIATVGNFASGSNSFDAATLGATTAGSRDWGGAASGGTSGFVFEASGLVDSGSDFPYPVEITQAIEVNETTNNDLDYETDVWGHRLTYVQDRDSIDTYGLHSRTVPFPQVRDSARGIQDVWPQSDALFDAATTLLSRAKDPFEAISGSLTGAFALPYVGQKARFVFRGVHETENGDRVWLDLDALYWVQRIGWRVSDAGLRHIIRLTNIPDDYLDPSRIMAEVMRRQQHHDSFFAEIETGTNSGATVDPKLIGGL